jgi:hypothetical protein
MLTTIALVLTTITAACRAGTALGQAVETIRRGSRRRR